MAKTDAPKQSPGKRRESRIRRILMYVAPLMMIAAGAALAMTQADESQGIYVDAVLGGLAFALAPIGVALVLTVVVRLVTWPFRRR